MIMLNLSVMLFVVILLGVLILQLRKQNQVTSKLISDVHIRTRLYQDADESTTFILSQTIQNVASGTHDPNLANDSFTLQVIRELVKRKIPKKKWMEVQSNERLVHEIYLLLRQIKTTKAKPKKQA